ncbi:hypothetical protein chiPu_0024203 [Chiloscyllium punctatum]|uniref:Uncharacterized protein n=1 Tax=Chiloscyllium punctatum TaxID=137246 RepID=A0A401TCR6_CHIPU|nr:hypothetical protein [Chiloscyllium punctatum]
MRLPETVIEGDEDMAPLRDRMAHYIRQLDAQLRALRQTARDQQDIRDQTKQQQQLPPQPLPGVGDKDLYSLPPDLQTTSTAMALPSTHPVPSAFLRGISLTRSSTFFNAWLEVLPDIQTICLLCMSERNPRPTCLRRAEAMDLGGVHVRNNVRYARRPHFGPGLQRIRDAGPVDLRLL